VRLPFSIPPRETARFDVVGLGLNSVDLLAVVDHYPVKDSKQRVQRFAQLPGGQMATAMSVCSRLGWRASYIGCFGDDPMGRLSRESLIGEGVDVSASRTVVGTTNQFAIVLVDARSGARTVLWDRHPALTMDPSEVPKSTVTAGRLLVVDCYDTAAATEAARCARDVGIPTVIDVEHVRPGINELLQNIDAIIAAESFPEELTGYAQPGRALEAMALEFGAPLVCVTLGAEGSMARCAGREFRTPAFAVECVDSTGAGDAFRGGFASGCLRAPGGDVEDVLLYANAVAALNCRALGARSGMPTAQEVELLLIARQFL
jgi:sugar/nucleoside kinase (ribokinase family)